MHNYNIRAGLAIGPAFFWVVVSIMILSAFNDARAQATQLPVTELTIDSHTIQVEIAANDQSRSYGLMNRAFLPPDTGMLFVFDTVGQPCFWMKNTPLPLSIAFITRDGVIVNMADMQPHNTTTHCPLAPILYALEMEQGWFASKGIQAGARVNRLPRPISAKRALE